jgi:predicted ribosomally synthesized peptide with SipW-like signal peptide
MSEKTIELNRRRVLGGMATLGVAAAAAGAGTYAAFSDTEQSNDNQVSAGTLDLTFGGSDGPVEAVSISNAVPGDSNTGTLTLTNDGSVDGTLDISVADVSSSGGDNPEAEGQTSSEDTGAELEEAVDLTLTLETGSGSTSVYDDTVANLSTASLQSGISLNSGNSKDLEIRYEVNPKNGQNDNHLQGDTLSVDFDFTLTQA